MIRITIIAKILLMALFMSFLSACNDKCDAVRDLLVLRTDIKNNSHSYTVDDWQNALDRYSEICERLSEIPFNREERLDIDKVKGEIAGYAATSVSQQVVDMAESISEEVGTFANGFENTFTEPKSKY